MLLCQSGGQSRHFNIIFYAMHQLQSLLEGIGLNPHESRLYLYLLRSGEHPASVIAKATGIPRSTVRGTLDKLCERGVVSKLYKRNTQYYHCKKPKMLMSMLESDIKRSEKNKKKILETLPIFNGIYEQKNIVPKVQVFEGEDQLIEAFNQCLYEDIDELLIFTSYKFLQNPIIRKNDDDFFIKMRAKKGIHARVLVGKTSEASKMKSVSKSELRQRRFIPKKHSLPGNIHIYGDSVMYFSASENEYMAVLVESSVMANTMRTLFEFMWEQCQ